MRVCVLICLALLAVLLSGCTLTPQAVSDINEKIEERYNSFSTLHYTITELLYEDGQMVQKQEYTEMFKKPDKIKQIFAVSTGKGSQNQLYVCNRNVAYSQIAPDVMNVYEYVNLPAAMDTYCGYFVNQGAEKWKIPMEITDETKYAVVTSEDTYNGKKAIKAVVTALASKEEKEKRASMGLQPPKETVVTYWFDENSFAIVKEEHHSYITKCEGISANASPSATGEAAGLTTCVEIEVKLERTYEGFYFDTEIPDSYFEVDPADYPGVEFVKETVDTQEKFT